MQPSLEGVKTVLLDIDQKFPFSLNALPTVLEQKWDDEDFKPFKDAFPEEARSSPQALEDHVKELTARDVKIAYLKNLQGYLWQSGYENGAYSTPLFPDVAPQLKKWHKSSLQLAIYSSGSVFAQKLLFGHVQIPEASDDTVNRTDVKDQNGSTSHATLDLRDRISEWFDTTNAGPKTEADSYTKIATEIGKELSQILFLSDNVKEIKAATEAGMQAILVDRPGNAALTEDDKFPYKVVESLDEIVLPAARKSK